MYKWNAEQYRRSSSNQKQWGAELLSKLALRGTERVLDIGCGDGILTASMAKKLPQGMVVGIDSSKEMIALAQNNHPAEEYPNLSFMVRDARQLDFAEEFDAVFSNACFHWILEHIPLLEGIRRSLKNGGKMLVQMGGKGNAEEMVRASEILIRSQKWGKYFKDFTFPYGFYSPEDYKEWLTGLRFKISRIELIPKNMVFNSKPDLSFWIQTTWLPYTQAVPEYLRQQFINELTDMYIRDNPVQDSGWIYVRMIRLEVEAYKE